MTVVRNVKASVSRRKYIHLVIRYFLSFVFTSQRHQYRSGIDRERKEAIVLCIYRYAKYLSCVCDFVKYIYIHGVGWWLL